MGRACRGGRHAGPESTRGVLDPWTGTVRWSWDLREAPAPPSGFSRSLDPLGAQPSPRFPALGVSLNQGGVPGVLIELPIFIVTRHQNSYATRRCECDECDLVHSFQTPGLPTFS